MKHDDEYIETTRHYNRYKRREKRKTCFAFTMVLIVIMFFCLLIALFVTSYPPLQ